MQKRKNHEMKQTHLHIYNKVVVPIRLELHQIADYLSDGDYEALAGLGFSCVGVSVTISRTPIEKEVGRLVHEYEIIDIDVDRIGEDCVLFNDKVVRACEDYVYTYESDIVSMDRVQEAFEWFDSKKVA